jgi:anaerobic magnesium-protoporphyrin IX monomethyl ester cyclase
MAKILLINPSKWRRGITPIWIASHSALLKSKGHQVKLFNATFYEEWSIDEISINTSNDQYKPSKYSEYITLNKGDILHDMQNIIDEYQPDIIFWSAVSSHIHGEGEYVNIQYGYELIQQLNTKALKITGGLQPTAKPKEMLKIFPKVNYFIGGESEFVLTEIADIYNDINKISKVRGITFLDNDIAISNPKQRIINDLNTIPSYDYSVFEDQVFYRPYNGKVDRAVDYELSRGCIYACSYCVETIIQEYYGFTEVNRGVLKNVKGYLRNKSASRVFSELKELNEKYGISLIRCQDTNFLTIDKKMLAELAILIDDSNLDIKLYIETRPEGINSFSLKQLKKLKVDAVGMGIEVSDEDFREGSLNRFASQIKIINAFKSLREEGIKRTAYNIIGLPDETENMIMESIKFNRLIDPDNITVAFYSPYIGTPEQEKSLDMNYFDDYEYHVDSSLRSHSKSSLVDKETLEFYKKYFIYFVKNGFDDMKLLKKKERIQY